MVGYFCPIEYRAFTANELDTVMGHRRVADVVDNNFVTSNRERESGKTPNVTSPHVGPVAGVPIEPISSIRARSPVVVLVANCNVLFRSRQKRSFKALLALTGAMELG